MYRPIKREKRIEGLTIYIQKGVSICIECVSEDIGVSIYIQKGVSDDRTF